MESVWCLELAQTPQDGQYKPYFRHILQTARYPQRTCSVIQSYAPSFVSKKNDYVSMSPKITKKRSSAQKKAYKKAQADALKKKQASVSV